MSKPSVMVPSFPPTYNTCPDFWAVQGNVCVIPTSLGKNVGSIYSGNSLILNSKNTNGLSTDLKTIDFTDANWGTGTSLKCNQQVWANTWGILFDGITNFNGC